jgi:hypothetical protein
MEHLTDPTVIDTSTQPMISNMITAFPNDTVAEYLATLTNLSLNLRSLKTSVETTASSLSVGNFTHATENVNQLERSLGIVKANINSLRIIVRTMVKQGWNSTTLSVIQQEIEGVERISDEYAAQITLLEAQVNLRSPLLHIVLSNETTFIDGVMWANITLLARNGTALADRSVSIIWGSNEVVVRTDIDGMAGTLIRFPAGFPAGNNTITASFQPTGPDAKVYVSTYAGAPILIKYHPTELIAEINPSEGMPLDTFTANGTLAIVAGGSLANRTLIFILDNSFLGTGTTDVAGRFLFNFQIPPTIENGNHTLLVFFNPRADILAPSNTNLQFRVTRDQTSTAVSASSISFSGMTTSITGRVSGAAESPNGLVGNVVVTLDGSAVATIPVGTDGTFSSSQSISLNTGFGNHVFQVFYTSDDPRVAGSSATVSVYVVNSPTLLAVALFCGLAPGILVARKRRIRAHEASIRGRREASERGMREGYPLATPLNWERVLQILHAEHTSRGLVAASFRLVRTLLSNALGRRTKESETHWEFYSRAITSRPVLRELLMPLVKLFELAEYSQFDVSAKQGERAKEILIELHNTKQM